MKREYISLLITFILMVVLMTCQSCGPAYHLKRSKYHELKAIAKGAKVENQTDTIVKDSLIYLPATEADTLARNVNFQDTVYLDSKDVRTVVKVDVVKRTVYIHSVCKPKTITVRQKFYITKSRTISAGKTLFEYWSAFVMGIVIGVIGTGVYFLIVRRRA
jgi:hypothetical protein